MQAQATQAVLKLLAAGRNPFFIAEVGTGKSTMALSVAAALPSDAETNARRRLRCKATQRAPQNDSARLAHTLAAALRDAGPHPLRAELDLPDARVRRERPPGHCLSLAKLRPVQERLLQMLLDDLPMDNPVFRTLKTLTQALATQRQTKVRLLTAFGDNPYRYPWTVREFLRVIDDAPCHPQPRREALFRALEELHEAGAWTRSAP